MPLRFPDPREEVYARVQEFQRLPLEQRLACLLDVVTTGMFLIRRSPNHTIIDQLFLPREAEWQRIQEKLFAHGK